MTHSTKLMFEIFTFYAHIGPSKTSTNNNGFNLPDIIGPSKLMPTKNYGVSLLHSMKFIMIS